MSVNYIPERKAIPKPKLSKTELMMGWYLKDRQCEASIDLSPHGDGIVAPVKVKSQDTTFELSFQPIQWEKEK